MQYLDILIVEDRADWQTIVHDAVVQRGYTALAVGSYTEAMSALEHTIFALAVVDPVLDSNNRFNRDGLSVLQMIRSSQPHMMVLIITGSLTRDVAASLQHLCPGAPVLLKERWEPERFIELADQLMGEVNIGALYYNEETTLVPTTDLTLPEPPDLKQCLPGCPRVLVVENRPDWQAITTRLLDDAGFFWRLAPSAQAALTELERESFHLIILDLKLQSHDLPLTSSEGWLLLDHLVENWPTTKVAILSGEAGPSDVADLIMHYPIIGFVEKQRFSPKAILQAVERATQAPTLRIQTFGQFRIWRDTEIITTWERPQAETIVKMLLARRAQGGRTVAADEMIARIWPDTDEESGRKKLLPLISNARRTLEPEIEPRDSHFILRSANGYFFDLRNQVEWDLMLFRRHIDRGRSLATSQQWDEALTELEQARDLYQGDFLAEDSYTDWVIDLRREIVNDYCDSLVVMADGYAALQQYQAAIDACEAVLGKDPLRESVYRRLMSLYVSLGDKARALRAYRDCTTLFEQLFGESPTPITRKLANAIAADDPIAADLQHWIGS